MSHIMFQTSPLPKTLLLKPSLPPPAHPFSGKLRKNLTVRCSSSSVISGGDSSVAALERCFSAPPAPVELGSSGSGEVGPVMKGGKYGAFGAVTLEKGKLDLSQKQSTSSPELATGGGGGDIGKKINHGGGDGGDDDGDDDDYFDDFDDDGEGEEGGLFRRRLFLEELFDRKFVDAVLNEWHKTMMDLPAGFRQACEMGLVRAPWRESFEFDRFDIRYLKVKDSAEKFAVLQFGVCPFRWDSLKRSFIAHPHNFFIFPRQEISLDRTSHEFLCQTTSMDFLAKYQFDFNACIREGVSYLSRRQEDEARKILKSLNRDQLTNLSHDLRETMDLPLVRVADVLFTERMKKRLSEWRDELLHNRFGGPQDLGTSNDLNQQFQTVFFKMRPALSLNGFTSHQLSLIRMVTRKHFEDLAYVRVNGESSSEELVVYTDSETHKNRLLEEVKNEHQKRAEMKINAAVGFRHVIDLLSSENKLIVGHNCILDIAHIHSKFLGPLPLTAEEFVSCINKCFPYIIDTKILLNAEYTLQRWMKKSSTSLSSAFSLLCPEIAHGFKRNVLSSEPCVKVEVNVDEMRSSNWNSGAKHEAGYDAFMTGCVFAQACSHLGIDFQLHLPSENLTQNEKLQKHMNLLYLSWINGDIIDLTTGNRTAELLGPNIIRKRFSQILFKNIVLIWGFRSQLRPSVIRECICKTLGPTSVISIYRLDQTAVFVQFSKAELVSDFLILKETLEQSNDAISVLHPLSQLLEGGNTRAATYETYKEICASPVSKVLFADQAEAVGIKWKTKLLPSNLEESQKNNSFHLESGLDTPEAVEKSKRRKIEDGVNDSSNEQLTCDEIIDSFLKVKSIRKTTNL